MSFHMKYIRVFENTFQNRDSSKDGHENDSETGNANYNEKLQISTHSKPGRRRKRFFVVCMYLKANNFIGRMR